MPASKTTSLITGATAGIGHEYAVQLAARGHDLVLVARDGARLEQVADDLRRSHQVEVEVLVTAVLRLSHAALGAMAERGHGGIINVSSVAAFLPRGSYSAAKAWVNSFSEWAHLEYKSRGVQVMALCPGFTKTEFHERMKVTRGDGFMWLEPDFLVRKALEDYEKGRAYSIPGAQYKTIIALTKAIPNRALRLTQSIGRR